MSYLSSSLGDSFSYSVKRLGVWYACTLTNGRDALALKHEVSIGSEQQAGRCAFSDPVFSLHWLSLKRKSLNVSHELAF